MGFVTESVFSQIVNVRIQVNFMPSSKKEFFGGVEVNESDRTGVQRVGT